MGKDKEQKERKAKQKLPEHLQVRHDNVICGPELNANVRAAGAAGRCPPRASGAGPVWIMAQA